MTAPTLTDQTAGPGYMQVQWTDADKPANFYAWRVYHRDIDETAWTKVYETFVDSPTYDINVYGWANVVVQELIVIGVAQNPADGVTTENPFTGAVQFTPAGGDSNYWLVHPTDPNFTVRMRNVKKCGFKDEIAHEKVRMIGRGYKVNVGDDTMARLGSMSFQLFDQTAGNTARQTRQDIESLFRTGSDIFLRTPFGDMWNVFIEDLSFDPRAGVGIRELSEGSLTFVEVA